MDFPGIHTADTNQKLKHLTLEWLQNRGVTLQAMAELVHEVQICYIPDLVMDDCLESVNRVLDKREVQNAVFTALSLDVLAEEGHIPEPLSGMLSKDDGLYGIDEVLALSIVNIYGSIGLTNFGYLDKVKPGIIGVVNDQKGKSVNTFLDDIIAAIVAAAAARLAHAARDKEQRLSMPS